MDVEDEDLLFWEASMRNYWHIIVLPNREVNFEPL